MLVSHTRLRTILLVLAIVAPSLPAAAKDSPAQVLEKWGLLGRWGEECAVVADNRHRFITFRIAAKPAGQIEIVREGGYFNTTPVVTLHDPVVLANGRLRFRSWAVVPKTGEKRNVVTEYVKDADGRIRVMYNFQDGTIVHTVDGKSTWEGNVTYTNWVKRCDSQVPIVNVGEMLENWGLIGRWAPDCSQLPSSANPVRAFSRLKRDPAQVELFRDGDNATSHRYSPIYEPTTLPNAVLQFRAHDTDPATELRHSVTYVYARDTLGRIRLMEQAVEGAKAMIKDGKTVDSPAGETPWMQRCDGVVPADKPVVPPTSSALPGVRAGGGSTAPAAPGAPPRTDLPPPPPVSQSSEDGTTQAP